MVFTIKYGGFPVNFPLNQSIESKIILPDSTQWNGIFMVVHLHHRVEKWPAGRDTLW